mmetsp:Transcript_147903/g.411944  ORF Transcript_147903/g.411944 Transcript_147903/m.411944 type:complete len:204 (+) Transcript_147903:648-1259(+)
MFWTNWSLSGPQWTAFTLCRAPTIQMWERSWTWSRSGVGLRRAGPKLAERQKQQEQQQQIHSEDVQNQQQMQQQQHQQQKQRLRSRRLLRLLQCKWSLTQRSLLPTCRRSSSPSHLQARRLRWLHLPSRRQLKPVPAHWRSVRQVTSASQRSPTEWRTEASLRHQRALADDRGGRGRTSAMRSRIELPSSLLSEGSLNSWWIS